MEDDYYQQPELNDLVPPKNHGPLPPFHSLVEAIFSPLVDDINRLSKEQGRAPQAIKRNAISQFIERWRTRVGNDIFPAFRLVLPDKDRDRQMYGLKETTLGKLMVKVLNISQDSPDGKSLINWKKADHKNAGKFPDICYDMIESRQTNRKFGNMSIGEVNDLLDRLGTESKEQQEILTIFYNRMNALEMKWLMKIILRYMNFGATEKTFFQLWHPDAMNLFNVTSNLKRVCWELYDPNFRLTDEAQQVTLLSCFQPQLAAFQKHTTEKLVQAMPEEFYIEEKMDGERIQIHMSDHGKVFMFFSRKGKDYTSLYGTSLDDKSGSLTKHLKNVIGDNENFIVDGEMVAWDPDTGIMVPFGSLKTAAKNEQRDAGSTRPLFMAFDILFLNNMALDRYQLRQRRETLKRAFNPKQGYFEILPFEIGTKESDIDNKLRKVVMESSEGLVIKNPDKPYRMGDRNDEWIKVKPEYVDEYSEGLDVCIIGGYYGEGHKGNLLASFLCGVRVDDGSGEPKFWSLCKVGSGFSVADLQEIRHCTDGKWHDFNSKKGAPSFMVLSEGSKKEIPDRWIHPKDSVVIEVKPSQVIDSTTFRTLRTVRYPRFKTIREDKTWESAMSLDEFRLYDVELGSRLQEQKVKKQSTKKRPTQSREESKKRTLGSKNAGDLSTVSADSSLFSTEKFYVMTDSKKYLKVRKSELEIMIKKNSGSLTNSAENNNDTQRRLNLIADRETINVSGVLSKRDVDILRPIYILDCIKYGKLLPLEPRYLLHATPETEQIANNHVDVYGDSYYRRVELEELKEILKKDKVQLDIDRSSVKELMLDLLDVKHQSIPGFLFPLDVFYFDKPQLAAANGLADPGNKVGSTEFTNDFEHVERIAKFCGARITEDLNDKDLTLILVNDRARVSDIRSVVSRRQPSVRITSENWIIKCWEEQTKIVEERYAVV